MKITSASVSVLFFLHGLCTVAGVGCRNTAAGNVVDSGCSYKFPMCFTATGEEPQSPNLDGSSCGKCINDKAGNDVDTGCSRANPRCVDSQGNELPGQRGGMACVVPILADCTNTARGGGRDVGCNAKNPICIDLKSRREVASGAKGTACAVCINSSSNNGIDYGCTSNVPRCLTTDGGEFTMNKAGDRCCSANGCPTACPCFAAGSLFAAVKSDPGSYSLDSCSQSYDKDSIQAYFTYGNDNIGLAGAGGGWWGSGACFANELPPGYEGLLSPGSDDLTKTSKAEGLNCASDLRDLLEDAYNINIDQDCDYVYT